MSIGKVAYVVMSSILVVLIAILVYGLVSKKSEDNEIKEDLSKIEQMNNFEYVEEGSFTGKVKVNQNEIKEVEDYLTEEELGYIEELEGSLALDITEEIESGEEDYSKLNGLKMTCTSSEYELNVGDCLEDTIKYLINSNTDYEDYYTRGFDQLEDYMLGRISISNYLKKDSNIFQYLNILDRYEYEYLQDVKDKVKYVGDYEFEEMEDEVNGIETVEGFNVVENDKIRNKLIRYYNITEKE